MKRALIGLVCLGGLAACEPTVTSQQPLVSAGPESVRPGLWAMLEDGCARPGAAAVQTWPACATPFWVGGGQVTYLLPSPIRTTYVLSGGRPMIVQQLGPAAKDLPASLRIVDVPDNAPEAPEYTYMAVQPEGPAPFAAGRVWNLPCPTEGDPAIPGLRDAREGAGCEAMSAQALRGLATRVTAAGKGQGIVWVAPA
jgi:hypothetical protein